MTNNLSSILFDLFWQLSCRIVFFLAKILSLFPNLNQKWGLRLRLSQEIPQFDLWIHAASMGEGKACLNAIEMIFKYYSNYKILLTLQTHDAYRTMQKKASAQLEIRLYPLEQKGILSTWFKTNPHSKLLIYESELWPNLIKMAKQHQIPIYWYGARVGQGMNRVAHYFPQLWNSWTRSFYWMGAMDSYSREFLSSYSSVDGDLWDFKNLRSSPAPSQGLSRALLSWHLEEWESVLPIIKQEKLPTYLQLRKISELPLFVKKLRDSGIFYTFWPEEPRENQICLVAEFGLTQEILLRVKQAFVGGSFVSHLGCHNPREAMEMGVETWVGPYLDYCDPTIQSWVSLGVLNQYPHKRGEIISGAHSRECILNLYENEKNRFILWMNKYCIFCDR